MRGLGVIVEHPKKWKKYTVIFFSLYPTELFYLEFPPHVLLSQEIKVQNEFYKWLSRLDTDHCHCGLATGKLYSVMWYWYCNIFTSIFYCFPFKLHKLNNGRTERPDKVSDLNSEGLFLHFFRMLCHYTQVKYDFI